MAGPPGEKGTDLCRKHGISERTLYRWKAKYGGGGHLRPSIAPERLLHALLLQVSFTIRSERML